MNDRLILSVWFQLSVCYIVGWGVGKCVKWKEIKHG